MNLYLGEDSANAIGCHTGVTVVVSQSKMLGTEGSGAGTCIDMIKLNVSIIVDSLIN